MSKRESLPLYMMDKCLRCVGGSKAFYYAHLGGRVLLVDPDTADSLTVPPSHFEKCYAPYSIDLPSAAKKLLDDLPDYRAWKAGLV